MGNQSNINQKRRYQQSPFACCGQQPYQQKFTQQPSSNIINSTKSKFYRASDQPLNLQQTGANYYNKNDIKLYKEPNNQSNINKNQQSFQSEFKNNSFAKFDKPSYGAYNMQGSFGTYNNYGLHTNSSIVKDKQKEKQQKQQRQKIKDKKIPVPVIYSVQQSHKKTQPKKQRQIIHQHPDTFIGQGQYSGRVSQFQNNKKIITFLSDNNIKQPFYKFYQTKDNTFLLNNSTIKLTNKVQKSKIRSNKSKKYQQQSISNIQSSDQVLQKLQQPIQLILQIDARIILATCLLIVGIVIVVIGGTVVYSQVGFFICIMTGIILYVCYLIICFIYNDVFVYLFNVRSFQQFQSDYKKLIKQQGQFAYHLHLQTKSEVIKQCYLLSNQNKFTKIQQSYNQNNQQIQLNNLKNLYTTFLMVKYKTKTAFIDAQSQFNIIKYFNKFINEYKEKYLAVKQVNKKKYKGKKNIDKNIQQNSSNLRNKQQQKKQLNKILVKTDFNYQLQPIQNLTVKPQSAVTVCYMQDQDLAGWMIFLFIISTLLGLSIVFLCLFQAYTKRYRINILNRFKIK